VREREFACATNPNSMQPSLEPREGRMDMTVGWIEIHNCVLVSFACSFLSSVGGDYSSKIGMVSYSFMYV